MNTLSGIIIVIAIGYVFWKAIKYTRRRISDKKYAKEFIEEMEKEVGEEVRREGLRVLHFD